MADDSLTSATKLSVGKPYEELRTAIGRAPDKVTGSTVDGIALWTGGYASHWLTRIPENQSQHQAYESFHKAANNISSHISGLSNPGSISEYMMIMGQFKQNKLAEISVLSNQNNRASEVWAAENVDKLNMMEFGTFDRVKDLQLFFRDHPHYDTPANNIMCAMEAARNDKHQILKYLLTKKGVPVHVKTATWISIESGEMLKITPANLSIKDMALQARAEKALQVLNELGL